MDMIWIIVTLAIFCVVFLILLSRQDKKNAELSAENGLLKGRMETLKESTLQSKSGSNEDDVLNVEGVQEAVRHAGLVPEQLGENWTRFMVSGEAFFIDTSRLPQVFVIRLYDLDPSQWNMPVLKEAAHLMSDELIIVKATVDKLEDGYSLHFFVAAMDRNYSSFQQNLMCYVDIIQDGTSRLRKIYDRLLQEKKQEPKILS